jgi:hypothetical protein
MDMTKFAEAAARSRVLEMGPLLTSSLLLPRESDRLPTNRDVSLWATFRLMPATREPQKQKDRPLAAVSPKSIM